MEPQTVRCEACGGQTYEYAIFCSRCGTRRPEPRPPSTALLVVGAILGILALIPTIYLGSRHGLIDALAFLSFFATLPAAGIWLITFLPAGKRYLDARGYRIRSIRYRSGFGAPVCFVIFVILAVMQTGLPKPPRSAPDDRTQAGYASGQMDEAQYRTALSQQSHSLGQSLHRFALLAGSPRIADQKWRIDVAAELATWRIAYEEAQRFTPPSKWTAVNQCYCESLRTLNEGGKKFAQGIDHYDARSVKDGTALFNKAISEIDVCTAQIQVLNAVR